MHSNVLMHVLCMAAEPETREKLGVNYDYSVRVLRLPPCRLNVDPMFLSHLAHNYMHRHNGVMVFYDNENDNENDNRSGSRSGATANRLVQVVNAVDPEDAARARRVLKFIVISHLVLTRIETLQKELMLHWHVRKHGVSRKQYFDAFTGRVLFSGSIVNTEFYADVATGTRACAMWRVSVDGRVVLK